VQPEKERFENSTRQTSEPSGPLALTAKSQRRDRRADVRIITAPPGNGILPISKKASGSTTLKSGLM
jgi:hypothetical protein